MTPEGKNRSPLRIFELLLELEPDQREEAIDELCAGDTSLRDEVLGLIRADEAESDSDFLTPISGALIGIAGHAMPERIGPFEIIEPIGEGGFGVVYLARQSDPIERLVAVKVIKPGMDSRAVIKRFNLERRALALMEHPHVASVIDGGVISQGHIGAGRPWFAMEYVDGAPITEFARDHGLSIEARLHLIIQACAAAQHAHSKAIIHRDLKPSNILVTQIGGNPFCKVIDFGVSKALEGATPDGTLFTNPGAMVGTPLYMSPEQAMGSHDIDIRSDVYSMGMVLYELITGCPPYEREAIKSSDIASLRRLIEHVDPVRPSSRVQKANGTEQSVMTAPIGSIAKSGRQELDWITMRAIDKDPQRRYATIADLGQDLERFLRNEPVDAGPPSRSYRVRKFVRRNRVPVTFGGITAAALVIAAGGMLVFGLAAERARAEEAEQRATAERQAQRVRDINYFLLTDLFSSMDSGVLGADASLVDLLDEVEPSINVRFEGDYDMLALLHSNFATMNQKTHRYERALKHADQAVAVLDRATDLTDYQRSGVYHTRAGILQVSGQLDRAERDVRESIRLLETEPESTRDALHIRNATLGSILHAKRQYDEAEPLMRGAIDFFAANITDENRRYLSIIQSNHISLLLRMERFEDAASRINQLLSTAEQMEGRARTSAEVQARFWQMQVMRNLGKHAEAAESSVALVDAFKAHEGEGSPQLAVIIVTTGSLLAKAGRFQEAIPYLEEGLQRIESVYGPYHYELERHTNIVAGLYADHGMKDAYHAYRRRGLLLRLYVAGPGEQESVLGIMPEGEALMGTMAQWAGIVEHEASSLPLGHPKRARFLAHAAIGLGSIGQEEPVERYLMDAFDSLNDAERVDEVRRILAYAIPDYYDRNGDAQQASRWRERLSGS
ncbi:MAG: protein kinase [Phycisphaerales bacterium]|nr:protein kinase [Phycisphaerales bacterium]